ncbi:unnamed protein product [Adineta steineri]|uniref:Uncharacterized protein n=1 Tax=Adineta steineri TaxID=433720 RepID=A0A816A801_9BILA|nr:unnamed protein product [Adineta steineri]CAF1592222.1 unnamed protein product [Adineta steineri]
MIQDIEQQKQEIIEKKSRKRCRLNGITSQTNEMLLTVHQDNQQIHEKEMDDCPTIHIHNDPIDMSLILFENQESNKENAIVSTTNESSITTEEWISPPSITIHRKKVKQYNLCNDHWNRISKLVPNYNELSPYQFKDVLIRIIPLRDRQNIEQWLVNFSVLEFIQQRTQLMCDVFQLKIEHDYWIYMNNLTNMPVVIWLLEISKDIIRQNSINWDHTKTKANIERRREMIHCKLQRAENHLYMHLQQPYSLSCQMETKTAMDHSMNIIMNALIVLVQNSLSPFRTNFKQKKILLEFDIHDVHLVKSFYALNPTMEQILTIQKIWRAKLKLCQKAIRQTKKNQSSSSMIYHMTTESMNLHQPNILPSIKSLSPSMSKIVMARLENMEERTQRMLNFNNTISDSTFF